MPLEKHLVVHLQDMYATERDYREYLNARSDKVDNAQLQSAVQHQLEDIQQELDVLRRCLSMMGTAPKEDLRSPVIQAFEQEDQFTMREMPNMTMKDMDVHLCLTDIKFGHAEIGAYQGIIDMAKGLNRQDLVNLLQQNIDSEQQDVQQMQSLLPTLINQSRQQAA